MSTKEWREANKESIRASRRKWYNKNKKHARSKVIERREKLRTWFKDYKKTLYCNNCPESRWYVLDFHHRDPETKEISISYVINWGWSKKRIMKEVEKCDCLCANCHRELHYLERQ
jgi:hypothetical protein